LSMDQTGVDAGHFLWQLGCHGGRECQSSDSEDYNTSRLGRADLTSGSDSASMAKRLAPRRACISQHAPSSFVKNVENYQQPPQRGVHDMRRPLTVEASNQPHVEQIFFAAAKKTLDHNGTI
jgi:hypothetical protein